MAKATRQRGYRYFGVTDHSQSAHYAGGLSVEEIEDQQAEADRLNDKFGAAFRIFKGIESDILPDGSLDYPDDVLRRFDFVVASVHGQFRLDRATQTKRILKAVRNPFVTILGHMTGRQLLRRPGYDVDVDKILIACGGTASLWRSTPIRGGSILTGAGLTVLCSLAACSASTLTRTISAKSITSAGEWQWRARVASRKSAS